MVDIRNLPEVVDIVNAALNNGNIIELKDEGKDRSEPNIVAVEIRRTVKTKKKA